MVIPTTFHDLLDPLTGERVSIRLERGAVTERSESLDGGTGRDLDASGLWILPALYDADAHLPILSLGLRLSDVYDSLVGGVARVNVALQWQEILDSDLETLVGEMTACALPAITPVLSVHSDLDSAGFGKWLEANVDTVKALMPPVCKLYSYSENFWENLDSVFAAGLLPIIYCADIAAVDGVVARAPGPVHFRHAISDALVSAMRRLPGATLQTSPHFLVAVDPAHRSELHVLPPVAEEEVRDSLAAVFLEEVDLLVSDHNAPPLGTATGPGLQVEHTFLSSIITAVDQYGWPLGDVWAKATTRPAALFGVDIRGGFTIVDPDFVQVGTLWGPRQTPDRAPYLGIPLRGRVLATGSAEVATLV
jgi:dihydroorotase-like cyclic amidohydrolase